MKIVLFDYNFPELFISWMKGGRIEREFLLIKQSLFGSLSRDEVNIKTTQEK